MDTEIEEVKQEIRKVEQEIRKVEQEIEGVERQLTKAVTGDDVAYWRKEKEQLRKEKEQLRKDKEQLRKKEDRLREEKLALLKTSTSADDVKDSSEAWIRHMLLPQLPELPKNKGDLTKVLFPEQHRKLPVPKEIYKSVAVVMPELAVEVLVEADGSRLPVAVGHFLSRGAGQAATEMDTTLLVAGCLKDFFDVFRLYSGDRFEVEISFNSTEKQRWSRSQTTAPRTRPDTIAIASGCTFLVGEDKVADLHAAEDDLTSKIRPLNPTFYGELSCILGYIAAGTKFQWMFIGKNGSKDLHRVGRCFDLSNISDRCYFFLSVGYAFQLLKKMTDSVPDVPGRRAMFSKDVSSDGKREIFFTADKVVKRIRDFNSYCADQNTSLSEIQKAYDAAKGCRFLLQADSEPTVNARGTYKVRCSPLGYSCSLKSEQDCWWMASCVCQALCILHNAGLVHRDIRFPNIVRLSETDFMLIDLESVADAPFRVSEGFRYFSGWNLKMFEGSQYTSFSDMYSLGELLDAALPDARTPLAEHFVRKLTSKQLSASDALHEPWLSNLNL